MFSCYFSIFDNSGKGLWRFDTRWIVPCSILYDHTVASMFTPVTRWRFASQRAAWIFNPFDARIIVSLKHRPADTVARDCKHVAWKFARFVHSMPANDRARERRETRCWFACYRNDPSMVTHADENEGESKKLSCTVIANIFMLSTVCPYRIVITSRMFMQIHISIYNYRYAY